MSTINSLGSYESLFDDDDGTLGGICFDIDDASPQQRQQASSSNNGHTSWCKSSASSCCSLCRLPVVSEAGEDESNVLFPGLSSNDASLISGRPRNVTNNHGLVSLSRAAAAAAAASPSGQVTSSSRLQALYSCGNNKFGNNCCDGNNQGSQVVPIKSISIPRSCFSRKPYATKSLSSSTTTGIDYLSSESSLPDDALSHIINFLDVKSLVNLRGCSKKLYLAVSKDTAGWVEHCHRLWSKKANVCSAARSLLLKDEVAADADTSVKNTAMEAYKLALKDSSRGEILHDEICYDAHPTSKGIIWSFRFKESAGRDWTSWDPWWNHEDSARKLVFLADGSIMQVYPQASQGSETRVVHGTKLYHVFSERTVRNGDGVEVPAPRIEMKWRFVRRPLDMPEREEGAYVRITVGGRDVPTYVCRRSPNGNWGFVLESCWGVYASFEFAPKSRPTSILDHHRRGRLRRTRDGGQWVDVDESDGEDSVEGEDEEDQRERMRNVRRRIDLFVEESAMTQTGYSQWREALLYNIGAVTLPEGIGNPSDEFDNAWQNAMLMR